MLKLNHWFFSQLRNLGEVYLHKDFNFCLIDELKRDNKNRPREESSKKPVKRFRDVVGLTSELKSEKRDPRFDSMCGEFDEKVCMKN